MGFAPIYYLLFIKSEKVIIGLSTITLWQIGHLSREVGIIGLQNGQTL